MLPSFPSLRERNLRVLYGSQVEAVTGEKNNHEIKNGNFSSSDKSPKGSVDEKIRPLVDLINRHPEYVTLSSCSGRVALFDPASTNIDNGVSNDGINVDSIKADDDRDIPSTQPESKIKSTKISGKGRGRWIFVTHDVLPDLGPQMIRSLVEVGKERFLRQKNDHLTSNIHDRLQQVEHSPRSDVERKLGHHNEGTFDVESPITFKHEPPLLHVAAASLEAGKNLLRIAKSTCAMRESGLVATNQRVTVELRTVGTMLCVPLMVKPIPPSPSPQSPDTPESSSLATSLLPNEDYLIALADMANERMHQNQKLIDKLFRVVKSELFKEGKGQDPAEKLIDLSPVFSTPTEALSNEGILTTNSVSTSKNNEVRSQNNDSTDDSFEVMLQPLPSLNLWKSAAVIIPRSRPKQLHNNSNRIRNELRKAYDSDSDNDSAAFVRDNSHDLDVLAFGGQGIGPTLSPDIANQNGCLSKGRISSCRRWNVVFQLPRRNGRWSNHWKTVPIASLDGLTVSETSVGDKAPNPTSLKVSDLETNAGTFRVRLMDGFDSREGHTACTLPILHSVTIDSIVAANKQEKSSSYAVALFGGRTGGPLSPSNDLILFSLDHRGEKEEVYLSQTIKSRQSTTDVGLVGIPMDVRGSPPEPRFGHSMTALHDYDGYDFRYASSADPIKQGEPLAVIAGGAGLRNGNTTSPHADLTVALFSVYILSRVLEPDSGFTHLRWDRIADMPFPRFNHAASIVQIQDRKRMFVFGGISEVDDPFCQLETPHESQELSKAPYFELFIQNADGDKSYSAEKIGYALPQLIGPSAITLPRLSSTIGKRAPAAAVLIGGVQAVSNSSSDCHTDDPLRILTWRTNARGEILDHDLACISSIRLFNDDDSEFDRDRSSIIVDFGTCVHHCLVALPRHSSLSMSEVDADTTSIIMVGGGVPSFAFGQSYARSYLINIKYVSPEKKRSKTKGTRNDNKIKEVLNIPTKNLTNQKKKSQTTKSLVEVNVLYVASQHAKKVKSELEAIGYLDKRYKMVKATVEVLEIPESGEININPQNLIAIPVAERCMSLMSKEKRWLGSGANDAVGGSNTNSHLSGMDPSLTHNRSSLAFSFAKLVVGVGSEKVPFSSSAMGRMKQKN